jgi:hypothetical protein
MCSKRSAAMTCIFKMQKMMRWHAEKYVTYYTRCRKPCVLGMQFGCTLKTHTAWKRVMKTYAALVCSAMSVEQIFCCSPKTHVLAADCLLHMQNTDPKHKCNRLLNKTLSCSYDFTNCTRSAAMTVYSDLLSKHNCTTLCTIPQVGYFLKERDDM